MREDGKPALPTDELKVTTDELPKAPIGAPAKLRRLTCLVAMTYGPKKSSKRGSNSPSIRYIKRANICRSKPLGCARILLLWRVLSASTQAPISCFKEEVVNRF